jgi:hypothetical protein
MSEFFANLDRYRAGGKGGGDRGAYLRLFNGGRYVVDRVGRGSFAVPNWSACFLGGIQPGPIQRIARDAEEDGLLTRFIYAVPGRQVKGVDRKPDAAAVHRYEVLFPALAAQHPPRSAITGELRTVVLHADAHQHRQRIDVFAAAMAERRDISPRLQATFDKWPAIFARLCLTFHLIDIADANAQQGQAPTWRLFPRRPPAVSPTSCSTSWRRIYSGRTC